MLDEFNKEEVAKFYDEHGYYIFRNVLPKELIEKSLAEIDETVSSQWDNYFKGDEYPGMDEAVIKLFNRNRYYRRVMYEWLNKRMLTPYLYAMLPEVKSICEWIGIKHGMFQMAANRFHLPGEDLFKTGVHQDIGVMTTDSSVTFWLPLIPSYRTNGAIKLWDKSHNEDVIVPEGIDNRGHSWITDSVLEKYDEVWEEYNPGDLLIFNTKTIHSSTSNSGNDCRWSLIFRFDNGDDTKYFDLEENPLHKGYIMVNDSKKYTGFKPGEDMPESKKAG